MLFVLRLAGDDGGIITTRPRVCPQNIIAEHEIRNISCAAQDPDDLSTFAYITKDLKSSHHYCHVFTAFDVVRADFLSPLRSTADITCSSRLTPLDPSPCMALSYCPQVAK